MQVRDVALEDLDVCYRIESECYPAAEGASRDSIQKRILTYPEGFLVLEFNGEVVGFVNSGSTNKKDICDEEFKALVGHDPGGNSIVIFSVAIQPTCQGKGFSKILVQKFIERARELEKSQILLLCKSALVDFYAGFGFDYVGESASKHGGAQWNEMRFDLSLLRE